MQRTSRGAHPSPAHLSVLSQRAIHPRPVAYSQTVSINGKRPVMCGATARGEELAAPSAVTGVIIVDHGSRRHESNRLVARAFSTTLWLFAFFFWHVCS